MPYCPGGTPPPLRRAAQQNGTNVRQQRHLECSAQRERGQDQGPYRGFLLIRCEECGEVKGYCAKRETYSFRCKCGHETPLEKLRPMFVKCKCGKEFRYKTNLTDQRYTHTCLDCGSPVDLEVNRRGTAYVTIGENERG